MIIGHKKILDCFQKGIRNKCLAHAYLFTGPAHIGKRAVALYLMQELCNGGPNALIIEPETGIGIGEIKKVRHHLNLSPHSAPYKAALIHQADKMTAPAANCLLKTLEEPSGSTVLFLTALNARSVLPTIASRCQIVSFLPVSEREMRAACGEVYSAKRNERALRLANGCPGSLLRYLQNADLLKEEEQLIKDLNKLLKSGINEKFSYIEALAKDNLKSGRALNRWKIWFRDLLLIKSGCLGDIIHSEAAHYGHAYSSNQLKEIIQEIKKTEALLLNPSINARLVLETLMLAL